MASRECQGSRKTNDIKTNAKAKKLFAIPTLRTDRALALAA